MPQRSIDFGPSIRDEVADRMSVEDKYNIWVSGGYYMTPGHVVGRVERDNGAVFAIGNSSATAPALVLETVSQEHSVVVYQPTFGDDGSQVTGFEHAGVVEELQRDGSAWDESYPAAETFDQWEADGRLPV